MYIHRCIEETLSKARKTFPATVVCGPRQSGKSTLLSHYLHPAQESILSLDNPEIRNLLLEDPSSYLKNLTKPIILNEIQYAPEILTYVKILIDKDRSPG